jgi:hypothetical protein
LLSGDYYQLRIWNKEGRCIVSNHFRIPYEFVFLGNKAICCLSNGVKVIDVEAIQKEHDIDIQDTPN